MPRINNKANKFKQVTKIVAKTAVAGMVGSMPIMNVACEPKDNVITTHVTTYPFSQGKYDNIENLGRISASADSIEVSGIKFKLLSGDYEGINLQNVVDFGLKPAFAAAKGKGITVDNGTFENCTNVPQTAQEWLLAHGYKWKMKTL